MHSTRKWLVITQEQDSLVVRLQVQRNLRVYIM
jgi:hypothetical protein